MKKFNTLFSISLLVLFTACQGPEGPEGIQGPPGLDGSPGAPGIQGQVIEVDGVDFGYDVDANLYSTIITFSDFTNFEVFESDAVLVYRFDGTIDLNDGTTADAWSQLPQSFFLEEGTLQYVFAHTFVDVELFIDGNFDLANIDLGFTDNQSFRIVILPSEYAESSEIDTSNLSAVMSGLGIGENQIQKIQLN